MERDEPRQRVLSDLARPSALAAFRIRNYRFQWPSDLLTSWAFEVEMLVLGWYIMVETGSVLLLTLLASLNYVGTLIAPVLGMIGDRIGHRDLLAAMRFAYTVLAATIMTLALTGHLAPLYIMIIVAIMGLIRPSDLGVRGALLADIMPSAQLVGAISLSRTTMDSARIAGALTGTGLFAALGIGHAYVVIACFYLTAAVLMLCVISPENPHGATDPSEGDLPAPSLLRDLKEGIVYAWSGPRNARSALCRLPGQSHRISADQRIAAVCSARHLSYGPDRSRLSLSEFCAGLADRFDHAQLVWRRTHRAAFDRRNPDLVRDAVGVRGAQDRCRWRCFAWCLPASRRACR